MSDRIYPVPIKPASDIYTWSKWPADVEPILRHWNRGHRGLTFARIGIFKCTVCEEFCDSHTYGAAVMKGKPFCDDCIISEARAHADLTWDNGC